MFWKLGTRTGNVLVDPFESLIDIENTEVLRLGGTLEFSGVGVRKDALTSVEADEDCTLASEIVSLELRVAA